jgi:hypothetical protein
MGAAEANPVDATKIIGLLEQFYFCVVTQNVALGKFIQSQCSTTPHSLFFAFISVFLTRITAATAALIGAGIGAALKIMFIM